MEVVDGIGLSAAGGTLARPSAHCGGTVAVVGGLHMTLALAAPVAQAADTLSAASGDGAWSGVSGLDSGQEVRLWKAGAGVKLSEVAEGSARPGVILAESWDVDMVAGGVQGNDAAVMDDGVGPSDQHRSFPSAKQRRAWLRDQKRKARK